MPSEKQIPLPALVLFWVTAAALIDAAIYEYLRAGWYLIFEREFPDEVGWLNLAFLPFGIGLIKRKPDSKSCIQTLLFLWLILVIFITVSEIIESGSTSMEENGWLGWLLVAAISIWSIVLLWCFKRYENYFNIPELTPEMRRNEKAIVSLIIISSALNSLSLIASEYEHEKQLDGIFAVHLDFHVIDSESKQPIKNSIFELEHTDAQHLSQRYSSLEKDGVEFNRWGLSGFTKEPFKVTFSADGYESTELTVTSEFAEANKSERPIQLKRLSTSGSEP